MPTFTSRLLLTSACLALVLSACNKPSSTATEPAKAATPASPAPASTPATLTNEPLVANVNGTPITVSAFNEYAARRVQPGSKPSAEEGKAILNEMVSLELVVQDAAKKGLENKPDVQKTIESQRRILLANAALREYVEAHPITDDQLKKEYEQRVAGSGTKELKARHILVKTEAEAKAIIAALDKGGDFAKLAKEKSSDSSAKEGGELGWFNPSQMVKPFSDAALAMKKGEYTKTPVKSQFGWHVIKLEDTRSTQAPPFDQMKERVRSFLQQKISQDYIDSLKTTSKVELKEENLPVAPEPVLKQPAPGASETPPAPTPTPTPTIPPANPHADK